MRRRLCLSVLLPALVLAAPAVVAAAEPTVLHLEAAASREVPPDRLSLTLRAEAEAASAARAQGALNAAMAKALERAHAARDVETATGRYRAVQVAEKNRPAVWRVSQTLTLAADAPRAAQALDLAGELQATGLALTGMAWGLSPRGAAAAREGLAARAIADLRREAAETAAALDMAVAGYKSVAVDHQGGESPIRPMMLREAAVAAAPVSEPAPLTLRAVVRAEILLQPR